MLRMVLPAEAGTKSRKGMTSWGQIWKLGRIQICSKLRLRVEPWFRNLTKKKHGAMERASTLEANRLAFKSQFYCKIFRNFFVL